MRGVALILGIGNPILTDDALGICAVRELRNLGGQSEAAHRVLSGIDLGELSEGGIGFLDAIAGYRCVIIIDVIQTVGGKPGDLACFCLDHLSIQTAGNPHSVNFRTALDIGRHCGYAMPEHIYVYSVEAADCRTFGMSLSPEVQMAFPRLLRRILADLDAGLVTIKAGDAEIIA